MILKWPIPETDSGIGSRSIIIKISENDKIATFSHLSSMSQVSITLVSFVWLDSMYVFDEVWAMDGSM